MHQGVVTRPAPLDFDNVCSEIGQKLTSPWTGQNPGKLQYAQPR